MIHIYTTTKYQLFENNFMTVQIKHSTYFRKKRYNFHTVKAIFLYDLTINMILSILSFAIRDLCEQFFEEFGPVQSAVSSELPLSESD